MAGCVWVVVWAAREGGGLSSQAAPSNWDLAAQRELRYQVASSLMRVPVLHGERGCVVSLGARSCSFMLSTMGQGVGSTEVAHAT